MSEYVLHHSYIAYLYRFVEFGSIKEADAALQQLNNFDMGDGIRLSVKVSEKQTDRKNRMEEKKENERFFSSLNMSKNKHNDGSLEECESYEMNEEEVECQNPFNPTYNILSPAESRPETIKRSPTLPKPGRVSPMGRGVPRRVNTGLTNTSPGKTSDCSSSLTNKSDFESPQSLPSSSVNGTTNISSSVYQESEFSSLPSSLNSSANNSNMASSSDPHLMTPQDFSYGMPSQDPLKLNPKQTADVERPTDIPNPSRFVAGGRSLCTYCRQPSGKKCAACRAPYCSLECQKKDWNKHKFDCKRLALVSLPI